MNVQTIIIIAGIVMSSYVFAAFTETVAEEKGYKASNWFWGGFFFTIIALIAAVGLPVKTGKQD
jgi:hypothetical protein